MLEQLEINNFQSHRATKIQFAPWVNTIQGNSDCGKSAVMRAINWLVFNPAGDYFVSDWAKKGKTISAPCEVTLLINGHRVTRKRDKDFNGYILDGQVFEATRNSVPPQVLEVLGIGEVNVQRQLDPPFLLSMSAGDVSRYINSLVNLTRIDKWTTSANSRAKSFQQKAEAAKKQVEEATAKVNSYSFVPQLEVSSARATELEAASAKVSAEISELKSSVALWEKESQGLAELPNVDKLFELLTAIDKNQQRGAKVEADLSFLKQQVTAHEAGQVELSSMPSVERLTEVISKLTEVDRKRDAIKNKLVGISAAINSRLAIIVPKVPEKTLQDVFALERWRNVARNLEQGTKQIREEIGALESNGQAAGEAAAELFEVEKQLSTMVCPLCGRTGIHEEADK